MSQRTYCDTCGREMVHDDDIRYIGMEKVIKEERKPACPEREICVWCFKIIADCIARIKPYEPEKS